MNWKIVNPALSENFRKVKILNLELLNQAKNLPVVLPSSQIKSYSKFV